MFLIALAENAIEDIEMADATLTTCDENNYWLQSTLSYVPENLKTQLETQIVEPQLVEIESSSVSIVKNLPKEQFDFVYIDGCLVPGNSIGADALFLEESAPDNFTILIDGRKKTVDFLRKHLKRDYTIMTNSIHHWTLFQSSS